MGSGWLGEEGLQYAGPNTGDARRRGCKETTQELVAAVVAVRAVAYKGSAISTGKSARRPVGICVHALTGRWSLAAYHDPADGGFEAYGRLATGRLATLVVEDMLTLFLELLRMRNLLRGTRDVWAVC